MVGLVRTYELLLMDVKHVLGMNPLTPAYRPHPMAGTSNAAPESEGHEGRGLTWIRHPGGLTEIGRDRPVDTTGDLDFAGGFVFDNETPRHQAWLNGFALSDRLVTAGEWLAFMDDGGYQTPSLWLSDGWAINQAEDRRAPLYWVEGADGWEVDTLAGGQPLDPRFRLSTSATTKPTPSPVGPGRGSPPKPSGRRSPRVQRGPTTGKSAFTRDAPLHPPPLAM
jgi:formylglycine-generating enzyme required for sulfatase activity